MKNIVLVGYRCTGKTAAGREAASRIGLRFFDTDELVEKEASLSVAQIVSIHGWEKFRELERKVVGQVSAEDGAVISLGGGAVLDSDNADSVCANSVVIWLDARPEVIFERMSNDPKSGGQRPSLTEWKDAMREIEETLRERRDKYEAVSGYRVDTSDMSVDEVAEKIVKIYEGS